MNPSEPTLPTNFEIAENQSRNVDPLTDEAGAHPVSTGIGAASGGAAGAAIGVAMGGVAGGVVGAVIGAVAGGLGGKSAGESIDPTPETDTLPPQHAWLPPEDETPPGSESASKSDLAEIRDYIGSSAEPGEREQAAEEARINLPESIPTK
jgi:phage tail tape-measure protein